MTRDTVGGVVFFFFNMPSSSHEIQSQRWPPAFLKFLFRNQWTRGNLFNFLERALIGADQHVRLALTMEHRALLDAFS